MLSGLPRLRSSGNKVSSPRQTRTSISPSLERLLKGRRCSLVPVGIKCWAHSRGAWLICWHGALDYDRVTCCSLGMPSRPTGCADLSQDEDMSSTRRGSVPHGVRLVSRHHVDEMLRTRLRWDSGAMFYAESRTVQLENKAFARIGAMHHVELFSPLNRLSFVSAFAKQVGFAGPASRTAAMHDLVTDLLPEAILNRGTKATFGGVVWGRAFRRFVRRWDPSTLAPNVAELVNVPVLVEEWSKSNPHYGTLMLAHQAWLNQQQTVP